MKRSSKSSWIFVVAVMAFILSALGVTPALADDEAPPPAATEAPVVTQEPVVAEQPILAQEPAATEEPIVTEAPVMTQEPVVTEPSVPVQEPAVTEDPVVTEKPVSVAETLEQLPDDTPVVVLDENNEALPLGSVEAVEIIAAADPMWCPVLAGVPSLPGDAGCTGSFLTPQDLIADMGLNPANYQQDGIVYFTSTPGGPFVLLPGYGGVDAADYDALKGYNLTLQGGWNGLTGPDFAINDQSDFGLDRVQIGGEFNSTNPSSANPWTGNVTVDNIKIGRYIGGAPVNAGLFVTTVGNVSVTDSSFEYNLLGLGVSSDGNVMLENVNTFLNDDGVLIDASSAVNVANSYFDSDYSYGLQAFSAGSVTLNNVRASGSDVGAGVTASGNVNVTNSRFWSNGTGLLAFSDGDIVLDGMTADSNVTTGAHIVASGDINVTNSDIAANGQGLVADSDSDITINGLTSYVNGWMGAYVTARGDINITNTVFADSIFAIGPGHPTSMSLNVSSTNGNVTLNSVTLGEKVKGASITAHGDINVLNSIFGPTVDGGIWASSTYGNIFITNSTFNDNANHGGAILGTPGRVVVSCSEFKNSGYPYSADYGLNAANVNGSLTLSSVMFAGNWNSQDYLYNGVPTINTSDDCPSASESNNSATTSGKDQILYYRIAQAQDQLPAALGEGNLFISAFQVILTPAGEKARNLAIILAFPILEGMQDDMLAILFWDGSRWVPVPGGHIEGNYFVITVTQPGYYVLVSQ